MAFGFQKRIKIAPGVRLNVSKSGVSTTVGARGASVNVGKKGVHANVGIPGTGISMRERIDKPVSGPKPKKPAAKTLEVAKPSPQAHFSDQPGEPPAGVVSSVPAEGRPVRQSDTPFWRGVFSIRGYRSRAGFALGIGLVFVLAAATFAVLAFVPPGSPDDPSNLQLVMFMVAMLLASVATLTITVQRLREIVGTPWIAGVAIAGVSVVFWPVGVAAMALLMVIPARVTWIV